jgi:hypothetical protein
MSQATRIRGSQCFRGSPDSPVISTTREAPSRVKTVNVFAKNLGGASFAAPRDQPPSYQNINIADNHLNAYLQLLPFHPCGFGAQGVLLVGKSAHNVLLRVSPIEDRAAGSRLALSKP